MLHSDPLAGPVDALKRPFDATLSAVALVLLSPLLVAIVLAILLDSGRPVLFSQIRTGRNFRRFRMWKFRTMVEGCSGPLITVAGDRRVTRTGRLLRATKLDELPQLWNVLIGDMSIVGPRPEVPEYVQMYRDLFAPLLTVRPGITDFSTLCFHNEEQTLAASSDPATEYLTRILPEKLRLAEVYLSRRTFASDLGIILQTIGVISRLPVAVAGFAPAISARNGARQHCPLADDRHENHTRQ